MRAHSELREYMAPRLTVFGSVEVLTASGTGASCEGNRNPQGQCTSAQVTVNPNKAQPSAA